MAKKAFIKEVAVEEVDKKAAAEAEAAEANGG